MSRYAYFTPKISPLSMIFIPSFSSFLVLFLCLLRGSLRGGVLLFLLGIWSGIVPMLGYFSDFYLKTLKFLNTARKMVNLSCAYI